MHETPHALPSTTAPPIASHSPQNHRRELRAFLEQLPPRRVAALLDVSNTLDGAAVLLVRGLGPLWGFGGEGFGVS